MGFIVLGCDLTGKLKGSKNQTTIIVKVSNVHFEAHIIQSAFFFLVAESDFLGIEINKMINI